MVTNRKFLKSKTEHYALMPFFPFFFITFLRFFFLQRVFFEILKLTFEILLKNSSLTEKPIFIITYFYCYHK